MCEIRNEFHLKYFGFVDCKDSIFYVSKWSKNIYGYGVYRFVLLAYCMGWLIYHISLNNPLYYAYVSNWNEFTVNLYLMASMLSVSREAFIRYQRKRKQNDNIEIKNAVAEESIMNGMNTEETPDKPLWLNRLVWVLFQVCFLSSTITTMVYWAFVTKSKTKEEIFSVFNFHRHVVLLVMITLDAVVVAIPVRLLHVIYTMGFSVVYCFFLLVLHWTNVNSTVYEAFSWKENPMKTLVFSIVMIFIGNPLVHFLLYLIYRARDYNCKIITSTKNNTVQVTEISEYTPAEIV